VPVESVPPTLLVRMEKAKASDFDRPEWWEILRKEAGVGVPADDNEWKKVEELHERILINEVTDDNVCVHIVTDYSFV